MTTAELAVSQVPASKRVREENPVALDISGGLKIVENARGWFSYCLLANLGIFVVPMLVLNAVIQCYEPKQGKFLRFRTYRMAKKVE